MVPGPGCVLTGGLTHKNRRGTLIDWNLCFNARGESSNRAFKSGTPAFMAPDLLDDKQIRRRTLGHDMESFFAVIIWMASLVYDDDAVFLAKPLAKTMLDRKKTPMDIVNAKENWLNRPEKFYESLTEHFEKVYREDRRFVSCLFNLRQILYPINTFDFASMQNALDKIDNKVTEDADPMKEGLFRQCMKEIDAYLGDTNGYDEMEWIDLHSAQHTPEGR